MLFPQQEHVVNCFIATWLIQYCLAELSHL